MRTKSSIGRINAVEHGGDINEEVTALKIDEDGGFTMAVESSGGKVAAEKPNPTIFLKACELCMYGMIVGMIYGVQEMQDAMLGFGEVMSTPSRRCRSHGGSVCTFERVFLT